ncbi:MAG: hypothetical protein A2Y63_05640 [Candidatus Riflebacteria bacterium RBG_13_59_9]|nr:MAG: hypothetical protein A2Y63_05640 [Candidatus Riflebacteria bacterium RBG_13_59_9]
MADTVKTTVLKTLEESLGEVTGLASVIRNPSKPLDRETVNFPVAFVFDDVEKKEQRNRLAMVTMPVQIEVWLELDELALSDAGDTLAAEIETKLLTDPGVLEWCRDIRPDPEASVSKFFVDEFLGGIVLRYIVQFQHLWTDPYDHGRR